MKIFITGSTGFIGTNLAIRYKQEHELWQHIREENVTRCLELFKPDVIINCAADIYNADTMWEPNILWVHECLEYVKHNSNTKMIQIGSSSEYGKLDRPSRETDRINPIDMYQATKGAATILCQGYARHYNLQIAVARPYSVYGPYEKSHRLFPRLWKAFKLNIPMKLFHGVHDFIYIDDFIRGIDMLVTNSDISPGEIVNFGSGKQHTNLEVYELFKKITNNNNPPVEYIEQLNKNFESNIWICDTSYVNDTYGFENIYSLESGIEKFLSEANYRE